MKRILVCFCSLIMACSPNDATETARDAQTIQTAQPETINRWHREKAQEPDPFAHAVWLRAIDLAQKGQIQEAQALCKQILTQAPDSRQAARLQTPGASSAASAAFVGLIALALTPSLIHFWRRQQPGSDPQKSLIQP